MFCNNPYKCGNTASEIDIGTSITKDSVYLVKKKYGDISTPHRGLGIASRKVCINSLEMIRLLEPFIPSRIITIFIIRGNKTLELLCDREIPMDLPFIRTIMQTGKMEVLDFVLKKCGLFTNSGVLMRMSIDVWNVDIAKLLHEKYKIDFTTEYIWLIVGHGKAPEKERVNLLEYIFSSRNSDYIKNGIKLFEFVNMCKCCHYSSVREVIYQKCKSGMTRPNSVLLEGIPLNKRPVFC